MKNKKQLKNKQFASLINSLSPLEFITIGTIIAYILSLDLSADEANALGNLFEMIGQIMLTYTAKVQYSPTYEEIETIKNKIKELEEKLK